MKPTALLLAVSLFANAAFVTWVVVWQSDPVQRTPDSARPKSPDSAPAHDSAPVAADLLAALRTGGAADLRDALRAAGVSENTLRQLVQARIWERYNERMKALQPAADPNQPYWRRNSSRNLTPEQRAEQRRLVREAQAEIRQILGENAENPATNDRYAFLPADKRAQLRQIEADYNELSSEISESTGEFPLKSDREKLRYLQAEKQRDIAALLTAAERETMELRTSGTANRVRGQYGSLLQSEEEYRAVFALQKAFDERFEQEGMTGAGPANAKMKADAEMQLRAQIAELLGAERIATLATQRDNDIRVLDAASHRLNLPAATTSQILALRTQLAEQSREITADTSQSLDQRKAALAKLAEAGRTQIRESLGADAADTYFERAAFWLRMLDKGTGFIVHPDGRIQTEPLTTAPPPAGG